MAANSYSVHYRVYQALKAKKPYRFVNKLLFSNIFPKRLEVYSKNEIEKILNKCCNDKCSNKELMNLLNSLIPLQDIIYNEIEKIYSEAAEKYNLLDLKSQSQFIERCGDEFWNKFQNNVYERVMTYPQIKNLCENTHKNLEDIIKKKILFTNKSNVYKWDDEKNATNLVINKTNQEIIAHWFGYEHKIWIQSESKSDDELIDDINKHEIKTILAKVDEISSYNQDILIDNIKAQDISEPQSATDFYKTALWYRNQGDYQTALDFINEALESDDLFAFKKYKELLHEKAILLSTSEIGKFKEALRLLNLLHYGFEYSKQKPEVVTLMGSNYKRLALIDEKGNYKCSLCDQDIDNLIRAIEYYSVAYSYRKEFNSRERMYDLLNILYLRKIVDYLNDETFCKVTFEKTYEKIDFEKYKKTLDYTSWWDVISYIEFKILLCEKISIDEIKEEIYSISPIDGDVNADQITITLRQINLYLTLVKNINNEAAKNDCSVAQFETLTNYLEEDILQNVK